MDDFKTALDILIVYGIISIVLIISIPFLQMIRSDEKVASERIKMANELRRTVIQVVGGFGVLLSLLIAWRTLIFNEFTKSNERVDSLVAALDSDQPFKRLSAISGLEQIVREIPDRQNQVENSLTYWMRIQATKPSKDVQAHTTEMSAALRLVLGEGGKFKDNRPRTKTFDLAGVDLRNVKFRNLNLSNVSLRDADLRGADLTYSDLRGADLSGAKLNKTSLTYCLTDEMKFDKDTDFRECDLQGMDFSGATFFTADLSDANLFDCKLDKVKFFKCKFAGYSLFRTDLSKVTFIDSDLRNLKISRSKYAQATIDSSTIPPSEFLDEDQVPK